MMATSGQAERLDIVLRGQDDTGPAFKTARDNLSRIKQEADFAAPSLRNLIPVGGVAAFAVWVKSVNDGVDALNDVKDATGAGIENISALENIANRTGASLGQVTDLLVKFNQVLTQATPGSEAAQALAAINLNAAELRKQDPAEALRRYARALAEFNDDGDKARYLTEQLGRSYKELAPFLNDLAEAQQLNATVTAQQAAEADKFSKNLSLLKANLVDLSRVMAGPVVQGVNAYVEAWKRVDFTKQAEGQNSYNRALEREKELINESLRLRLLGADVDRAELSRLEEKLRLLQQARYAAEQFGGTVPEYLLRRDSTQADVRRIDLAATGDASPSGKPILQYDAEAEKKRRIEEEKAAKDRKDLSDKSAKELMESYEKFYYDPMAETDVESTRSLKDESARRRELILEEQKKLNKEMDRYSEMFAQNTQSILADSIYNLDADNILGQFSDLLRRMAAEAAAANITRALFGAEGQQGGWFTSIFGSGSGGGTQGGRAYGGPTEANGLYRVNELGVPELLTVGNEQFLMMAGQAGYVSPLESAALKDARPVGSAGVSIEIHNYSGAQVTQREVSDGRGGRSIRVQIGEASAEELGRSGSAQQSVMRVGYGLSPRPMKR
jgi:hypothetical protein